MDRVHPLTIYLSISIGADLGRRVLNQPFYVSHISYFARHSQGFINVMHGTDFSAYKVRCLPQRFSQSRSQ